MSIKQFELSPGQEESLNARANLYGWSVREGYLRNQKNEFMNQVTRTKDWFILIYSLDGETLIKTCHSVDVLGTFIEEYHNRRPLSHLSDELFPYHVHGCFYRRKVEVTSDHVDDGKCYTGTISRTRSTGYDVELTDGSEVFMFPEELKLIP
jgi:hypothetical protein